MKIFIGSDHRGYQLKASIKGLLHGLGHEIVDIGTDTGSETCDYPLIARNLGVEVVRHPGSRGILMCMTGIGQCIAANKVPGVYAALVYNKEAAALTRQHNDSNVLVLGAQFVDQQQVMDI